MFKLKIIAVRQVIDELSYRLILVITMILLFIFMMFTIYLFEQEWRNDLIESSKEVFYKSFSDYEFASNILKSELIFYPYDNKQKQRSNLKEWKMEDSALVENKLNDEFAMIDSKEYEIKDDDIKYDLPSSYSVEKLPNGNIIVGKAKIINYSKIDLNLKELEIPSSVKISSASKFLIFHTHTSESYTVPEASNIANYRTLDERYNVIAVGKTLHDSLQKKNFFSVHDTTIHDYPNYNNSYNNSLQTIENIQKTNTFDFVLDIHRDALSSNYHFRPTVEISGENVAKIMFVIGTNATGLNHPKWMENLKLALMIQNRAEEMYPGLFRDLTLSSSRYNQHVSTGAFIIEVGATGNTMDEVKNSMKCLANVMNSFKERE